MVGPVWAGVQGKKLIEYGNDAQNTTSVRQHVREYEARLPFDGLVITVSARNGLTLGWHMFETEKLDPADFQQAIEDLKATKFVKLTDNFIATQSSPASVDFFDPKWSNICYNASLFAHVAKVGGCKGLMFDPEMYNQQIWSYIVPPENKPRPGHTLEEYRQQARKRGSEWIRAINSEFPDVTLLCLFGPAQLYLETGGEAKRMESAGNILLSAFYDGVCEAATPQTVLVDGYESSYGYRRLAEFQRGKDYILNKARNLSMNPVAFKQHVRAGFGICPEYGNADVPWHNDPADFSKNYFTPNGFREALNHALQVTDRYVWVYSGVHWLDDLPPQPSQQYINAMRDAKLGPGPGVKYPIVFSYDKRKAKDVPGYSDAETFKEMRKTMKEIYDFPKAGWSFSFDDTNVGEKQGWYRPNFNDSPWRYIYIGKWWEEQAGDYNGAAWYRLRFLAPKVPTGKRVFLAVGAADDWAKVWMNGKYVGGQHLPIANGGWSKPFALDVTKTLKPGKQNSVAIEVIDPGAMGGLWKSIKLMVK
jgi:hypothetical protein